MLTQDELPPILIEGEGEPELRPPDDRFIPVFESDLVRALADDTARFGDSAPSIRAVADALERVTHHEAEGFERRIAERYAWFNPDRETLCLGNSESHTSDDAWSALNQRLEYLLDKANFERLNDVQIDAAISEANSHGLRIRLRPELISDLSVWVRGRTSITRRYRTWRHPIKGLNREVDIYRRLSVIARPSSEPVVFLKLFRDIPLCDLEALLPHAEVRMSLFDRVKVAGGGVGALGTTIFKVSKLVAIVAAWTAFFWVVLVGFVVISIRGFLGYKATRNARDVRLTSHLYYQNLANNVAVVHSLVSHVCQEELKEATLAYALCRAAQDDTASTLPITSREELADRAHAYLKDAFNVDVAFDTKDALETMDRLNLWTDDNAATVVDPDTAVERLNRYCTDGNASGYHERMATSPITPDGAVV